MDVGLIDENNKKADSVKNRLQSNKVPFAGLSSNEILMDLVEAANFATDMK